MAVTGADRQKYLTELRRKAGVLLTESEGNYLLNAMKEYTLHKSVEKLMRSLLVCLNTPQKLDLLKDVRYLIPRTHVNLFDNLAPYSDMAHPILLTVSNKHDATRSGILTDGLKYSSARPTAVTMKSPASMRSARSKTIPASQNRAELSKHRLQLEKSKIVDVARQNGHLYSPEQRNSMFRVVTFAKDGQTDSNLGFTIKGGKEHNLGIYVSSVAKGSLAEHYNLKIDDQIIEVNGISFDHIALSSAGNLLSSLNKLKLVVKSAAKLLPTYGVREINPWNFTPSSSFSSHSGSNHGSDIVSPKDTDTQKRIQTSGSDSGSMHDSERSQRRERKVRIVVDLSSTTDIGFNIRGGSEYGLGIYVSSVDRGSLAERSGLRMGDQIVSANGLSFEKIKHKDAVDFLKSNKDIILSVRSVGKVPEARCIISEFSWLTPDGTRILDSNRNQLSSSMPAGSLKGLRDVAVDAIDIAWNATLSDFRSSKESVGIQTPDLAIPVDTLDLETRYRDAETHTLDDASPVHFEKHQPYVAVSNEEVQTSSVVVEPEDAKFESLTVEAAVIRNGELDTEASTALLGPMTIEALPKERSNGDGASKTAFEPPLSEDYAPRKSRSGSAVSKLSATSNGDGKGSWSNLSVGSNGHLETEIVDHHPKKGSRSRAFLKKQGEKLKEKFSFRRKHKSVDRDLLNSHLFERERSSQEVLVEIREKAKNKLTEDEYTHLNKHVKHIANDEEIVISMRSIPCITRQAKMAIGLPRLHVRSLSVSMFKTGRALPVIDGLSLPPDHHALYLEKGDIELFATQVLDLLDTPPKAELLKDIREIVFPYDTSRYDVRIARREIEYLEELGDDAEPKIFEGEISDKPPRRTIVKAVQEKGGKFQLKSKEEAEQMEKEKESKKPSKRYFQSKSILERDRTIRKYDSFHDIPQPSSDHAAPLEQIPNETSASPGLTAEEIDAMYAKVDKSAKISNRMNEAKSELDQVYDTLDTLDEDDLQSADRVQETPSLQEAAVIEEDSGTEDDDGYALPFVNRPPPEKSSGTTTAAVTRRKVLVTIPKNRPNLGISISGGKGSIAQPDVRIENIFPGGAASTIGGLKAGYQIISVNGESLANSSHSEAVDIIRRAYSDKSKTKMEMEVYID